MLRNNINGATNQKFMSEPTEDLSPQQVQDPQDILNFPKSNIGRRFLSFFFRAVRFDSVEAPTNPALVAAGTLMFVLRKQVSSIGEELDEEEEDTYNGRAGELLQEG